MAHDIAHELDIAASPEAVFDALTTQAGLAGWWTTDCFAEPTVDTISEFGFGGPEDLPGVLEQYGVDRERAKDARFLESVLRALWRPGACAMNSR